MEQVAAYSDRVVLMQEGRIILDGSPSEVFAGPRCEAAGTRLPESLYLRRAVEPSGLDLPSTPLTTEDLVRAVASQLSTTKEML